MARKREDTPDPNESILAKHYIYDIFKSRTQWIRHQVPVRILKKVGSSELYIESYISPPASMSLERLGQITYATVCFKEHQSVTEGYILNSSIYPSARKLTAIDVESNSVIQLNNTVSFTPALDITDVAINNIFNTFKQKFTLAELESMFNNSFPPELVRDLILDGVKSCLITGVTSNAYSGLKDATVKFDPIPQMISTDLKVLVENNKSCKLCSLGTAREQRGVEFTTLGRIGKVNIIDNSKVPKNIILFIGEAPGKIEEETGIVFHPDAPAGSVLYKVMNAANLPYDNCYFTNSVLCRPMPDTEGIENGKPTSEQIICCNTRLKTEVAILNPKITVLLGSYAYLSFFGELRNVLSNTGWQNNKQNTYYLPHPSYIARQLSHANNDDQRAEIKTKYLKHFSDIKKRFDKLRV